MKNKSIVRLIALFITIMLGSFSGYCQKKVIFTIKGTVVEAETQKPLAGVSIYVDYKQTGVITDSAGYYEIYMPKGVYNIKMSYIGYSTAKKLVELKDDLVLDVLLNDESKQLDEVIISSSAPEKVLQSPSLGVSYLNIKGIKKIPAMMGEIDILRSIQTLPGVSSVGEGANGLNIRGGNVDQNFILIDEAPVFNPTHLFGLFSVFAADAIRNLDLYKGGIPARYGGRIASVLDIKMAEPNLSKFSMQGGIGPISNKLMLEVPLIKDKLSILSAARLSYNDFWFKIFAPDKMKQTRANFYDIATKVFYKINTKNSLSFSSYFNNDFYRIDSLFSLENVIAKQTNFNYGHRNYSVKWNKYISEKANFELIGVLSNYKTRTYSPDSLNTLDLRNNIQYSNIKGLFNYIPVSNHSLTIGFNIGRYDINPGILNKNIESNVNPVTLAKERGMEVSLHIDDEFKVNPSLTIQYGIRGVNYLYLGPTTIQKYPDGVQASASNILSIENKSGIANSYWNFEPRAAINYAISEFKSIKFGYSRMGQFLQLISNNTTPLPTSRWKLADENIKPQTSNFISLGYFTDWRKGIWELSAETYYRSTHHLLDYISGANLQLNPTIETQVFDAKGKAYGIELMIAKRKGSTTGWLSYTYSRSFQKATISGFSNEARWYPSIFDKPHTINFTLSTQADKHNAFGLVFVYNTGRPFSSPTGTYTLNEQIFPLYADRNNDRVPAYHRLDFSWTISNPSVKDRRWQGSWLFTVYNLYGRMNPYSIFFTNSISGIKAYSLGVFATPLVSLAYNFKFK